MKSLVLAAVLCGLASGQDIVAQTASSNGKQAVALTKRILTRAIVPAEPCHSRTAAETAFVTTDAFVWLVFSHSGAVVGDEATVEWVAPSGKVYSSQIVPLRAGASACASARLVVAGEPAAALVGSWKALLKLGESNVTENAFELSLAESQTLGLPGSSVLPDGVAGAPYSHQLVATGGAPSYSFTTEGSLPAGLQLTPEGRISGTPAGSGSFQFPITVTDGEQKKTTRIYAIAVSSPALVVSPKSLTFSVSSTDQPAAHGVGVSSTGTPMQVELQIPRDASWLTVNPARGATPLNVTLQANPAGRAPGTYSATIIITSPGQSPGYVTVKLIVEAKNVSTAPQPSIDTIIGNPWSFPLSGTSLGAPLSENLTLALDRNGKLLVADRDNNVVIRINEDNSYQTIAGTGIAGSSGDGGPARDASLNQPSGIAVDQLGNIYISETAANKIRIVTPDGFIQTFAGRGAYGFAGDDGSATVALLATPTLLAVDKENNVYVYDSNNRVIRQISPALTIKTVVGNRAGGRPVSGSPGTSTPLGVVSGMAFSPTGDLLLAYATDDAIRRVRDGIISSYVGGGSPSFADGVSVSQAGLRGPMGLAFDPAGNLLVAEGEANRLIRIDPQDRVWAFAGGLLGPPVDGDATSTFMRRPEAIVVDSSGNVIYTDAGNLRVRSIDSGKRVSTILGSGMFRHSDDGVAGDLAYLFGPAGLARDPAGNVYISHSKHHRITMFSTAGAVSTIAGTGSAGSVGDSNSALAAELSTPMGLAFRNGQLYVADLGNRTIRRMTPGGFIERYPKTGRALNGPHSLAFDANGDLYVSESWTHQVTRIKPDGTIERVAGDGTAGASGDNGPATAARLSTPTGLAFDSKGNLYIADSGNNKVRRIVAGRMELFAGTGVSSTKGDGGPKLSASFTQPIGVAVDGQDNVYVTDYTTVRRIDAAGIIQSFAGSGLRGYEGDGGAAVGAKLASPGALLFDAQLGWLIADTSNNVVRRVKIREGGLVELANVAASPQTLTFDEATGRLSERIAIQASSKFAPFEAVVKTSGGGDWLRVTPDKGLLPSDLNVSIADTDLEPGTYQASVMITAADTKNSPITIPVSFRVRAKQAPRLRLESEAINFTVVEGGAPATSQVLVTNASNRSLPVTASISGAAASWASITSDPTTASAGQPAQVAVSVNPAGLRPGTYTAGVSVSGAFEGASSVTVPIRMVVSQQQKAILLSQTGLDFRAVARGGRPLSKTIAITNVGDGPMQWTANATVLSGGRSWLDVSQKSGSLTRAHQDSKEVEISVDHSDLPEGQYYGKIEFRAPGADNSPQIVTVHLQISPAGTKLPPEIRPSTVVFVSAPGVNPSAQRIRVANLTEEASNYYSQPVIAPSGTKWFTSSPEKGLLTARGQVEVLVQPELAELQPGTREGALTILVGGQSHTVKVISVVAADGDSAPASRSDKQRSADKNCPVSSLKVVLPNLTTAQPATFGQPVPIEVKVFDNCNNVVTSGPSSRVSVTFTNRDPQLNLDAQPSGVWSKTWRPQSAASQVVARVTASSVNARRDPIIQEEFVTFDMRDTSTAPQIHRKGVVSSASQLPDKPVAPGMRVTLYGKSFTEGKCQATQGTSPTELAGTEVRLADIALPVDYVCGGQINAQLPYDLPVNTEHQLLVRKGDTLSVPEPIVIASAQPEIFAKDATGSGQAAVRNSSGEFADAAHPVKAGDKISIYCTGLGKVEGDVRVGAIVTDYSARTKNAVEVEIGGRSAAVEFAGLEPNVSGRYVVIATVPQGVRSGTNIPITLRVDRQESPILTIAVK